MEAGPKAGMRTRSMRWIIIVRWEIIGGGVLTSYAPVGLVVIGRKEAISDAISDLLKSGIDALSELGFVGNLVNEVPICHNHDFAAQDFDLVDGSILLRE